MLYNTMVTVVFLILTAIMTNCGFCTDKKQVELKLSVYPETIAFGDTCYILLTVINHSDEIAGASIPTFGGFNCFIYDDVVQFDLNHQGEIWRGAFECVSALFLLDATRATFDYFMVPSGETVTFLAVPLQFPALEDLYQDDFWKKKRKELENNLEGLTFDFGIEFADPGSRTVKDIRTRLTQKVMIKLRSDKEMELINQWYQNTPNDLFPQLVEAKIPSNEKRRSPFDNRKSVYPPLDERVGKVRPIFKYSPLSSSGKSQKEILGQSPQKFMNIGNRYPGDPNVPKTWQGWKELEESLIPSTMRDEVRLTRILIQYCDTVDAAVLKELKDWFDGMNEIQRTVMAKSLRDRAYETDGTKLLPPFREVYKAIRQYDVVPVPESKVKHLRNLGLIE